MNPFTPWLPMYPPDAHPERPWWRAEHAQRQTFYRRIDGAKGWTYNVHDGYGGLFLVPHDCDAAWVLRRMDSEDEAKPIPAPPPMAGQVWVWFEDWRATGAPGGLDANLYVAAGTVATIAGVTPAMNPERTPLVRLTSFPLDVGRTWPMSGAVLVAGPTPWGRDVPWAPAGWKP